MNIVNTKLFEKHMIIYLNLMKDILVRKNIQMLVYPLIDHQLIVENIEHEVQT